MGRQSRKKRERSSRGHTPRSHRIGTRQGVILAAAIAALVGVLLWSGSRGERPRSLAAGDRAPGFSLATTDGRTVSLADAHGQNVLMYFSMGVGCDACFTQLVELQDHATHMNALGVTLVPVMPSPATAVAQEATRFGVHTPILIDESVRVSAAYDTLGEGMHGDLPLHSFILIDDRGVVRWRGDYPSMYVSSSDLLSQVESSLE